MVRSTMRMFMNELYDWSYKAKIYSSSLFAGSTLHIHCLVKGFANDRGGYLAGRPGVKWRRGPGNCSYWNLGRDRGAWVRIDFDYGTRNGRLVGGPLCFRF